MQIHLHDLPAFRKINNITIIDDVTNVTYTYKEAKELRKCLFDIADNLYICEGLMFINDMEPIHVSQNLADFIFKHKTPTLKKINFEGLNKKQALVKYCRIYGISVGKVLRTANGNEYKINCITTNRIPCVMVKVNNGYTAVY